MQAEAERVIGLLERRESPFSDGWEQWQPDAEWGTHVLLDAWDTVPATLWERRVWAYDDIAR